MKFEKKWAAQISRYTKFFVLYFMTRIFEKHERLTNLCCCCFWAGKRECRTFRSTVSPLFFRNVLHSLFPAQNNNNKKKKKKKKTSPLFFSKCPTLSLSRPKQQNMPIIFSKCPTLSLSRPKQQPHKFGIHDFIMVPQLLQSCT